MKNKVFIGLTLGAVLGIFDGLTAWFTPEARAGLAGIIVGSCFKGLLTGLAAGFFARKVKSMIHVEPQRIAVRLSFQRSIWVKTSM